MCLFENIEKTLQNTVQEKALLSSHGVLCALSGGADSVFLLLFLKYYLEGSDVELYAAHFNHMIRGEEADRDEAFCRELCKTNGIEFFSSSSDVPAIADEKSLGLEECARMERYAFLYKVAGERNLVIATAHNASDNTETLLMNLARGSGINGMCGIAPLRYEGNIAVCRPILSVSGDSIREYLDRNSVKYVVDSTNSDDMYSRNYIRHTVIPALKHVNPSIDDAARRLSSSARSVNRHLRNEAEKYLLENPVKREILEDIDEAVLREVIISLYERKTGSRNNISDTVIIEASDMVKSGKTGKVTFPKMTELCLDKNYIYFKNENSDNPVPVVLEMNKPVPFGEYTVGVLDNIEALSPSEFNIYNLYVYSKVKCDNINGRITVRTRESGDFVTEHSVNKKLKKLFCDRNIPLHLRNSWPVFCDDSGVIYVPDVAVSDRVFTKSDDGIVYLVVCK